MQIQHESNPIDRFLSFLEQDEMNISLLLKISALYLAENNLELAQVYFKRAQDVNVEACAGHDIEFLMARLLHIKGELNEALVWLTGYLKSHPENPEALGLISLLYFDRNETEAAAKMSAEALAIAPNNYEAKLVDVLLRLETNQVTEDEVGALLEQHPGDSRLHFIMGHVQFSLGQYADALEQFQEAIKIHPQFYNAFISLAWCQLFTDNIEDAKESYEKALECVDEAAEPWGGLGLIYALTGDLTLAKECIDRAFEMDSECFLTAIARSIYNAHSDPKKAQSVLVKALTDRETSWSEKLKFFISDQFKRVSAKD